MDTHQTFSSQNPSPVAQNNGNRQPPLFSLILLVIVVFLLQKFFGTVTNELALEGNLLKLMVMTRLVLTIFLPVALFLKILRLPARSALGLNPPPPIKTLIAVISGFVLILAVTFVLPMIISPSQQLVKTSQAIVSYGNVPEFLLSFLTISVFASVVDELFFRGILLRSLMKRHGKVVAVLTTAILTAMLHTREPFKLAHAFLMGCIFAISVVWTNSVYTGIILHSLHNSLALLQ